MITRILLMLIVVVPQLGNGQSMSCGGKIINEGVTKAEVVAACGTPTQVVTSSEGLDPAVGEVSLPSIADGDVDVLIYNFGSSSLMQRIWFEDGRVKLVESLGYGH